MSTNTPDPERSKRRRKIAKFALAGVAVAGVGAALTSAAWTDDVWFSANASTGSIELEGSLDGVDYDEADVVGDAIVIDDIVFENLSPGEERTQTLYLRNAGSLTLAVGTADVQPTGDLFAGASPVTAVVTAPADTELDESEVAEYTLTVTAPDWDNTEIGYSDATGSLTVQFTGSTDL